MNHISFISYRAKETNMKTLPRWSQEKQAGFLLLSRTLLCSTEGWLFTSLQFFALGPFDKVIGTEPWQQGVLLLWKTFKALSGSLSYLSTPKASSGSLVSRSWSWELEWTPEPAGVGLWEYDWFPRIRRELTRARWLQLVQYPWQIAAEFFPNPFLPWNHFLTDCLLLVRAARHN